MLIQILLYLLRSTYFKITVLLVLRDTSFYLLLDGKRVDFFCNPRNRSNQLVHEGVGNILPLISDFIKDAFCFNRLHCSLKMQKLLLPINLENAKVLNLLFYSFYFIANATATNYATEIMCLECCMCKSN